MYRQALFDHDLDMGPQHTVSDLPLISIITCTLNSERYLEQTLRSVFDQGYPCLDYWIIDGGSTDGTIEIIKKYEGKMHWISEPDNGIADAMNKGIRLSEGDIVAHLHSDDLLCAGMLERVGRIFRDHPETGWLIGNYSEIDRYGRKIATVKLPPYDYQRLKRWNFIGHQATFVRRQFLNDVGLFDVSLRFAMDYDLWLRLGNLIAPFQLSDVLASMRFHTGGLTAAHIFSSLADEYAVRRRLCDRSAADCLVHFIDYQWRRLRYCWRYLRYMKWMNAT